MLRSNHLFAYAVLVTTLGERLLPAATGTTVVIAAAQQALPRQAETLVGEAAPEAPRVAAEARPVSMLEPVETRVRKLEAPGGAVRPGTPAPGRGAPDEAARPETPARGRGGARATPATG